MSRFCLPLPPDLEAALIAHELKIIRNILSVILAVLVCYLVMVLQTLIAPLVMALFVAMLLQPILAWFERKNMRFGVSLSVIGIASAGAMWLCGAIVYNTTQSLMEQSDALNTQLNQKLFALVSPLSSMIGFAVDPEHASEQLGALLGGWLQDSAGAVASMLGNFAGLFLMTLLYLIVFLGSILQYERYLHYLRAGGTSAHEFQENTLLRDFEAVKISIVTYIKIKFLTCALHGIGYGLVCLIFGIKFWVFWGFLAFILTFIPTVGAIISTVPPILMGFILLDSWTEIIVLSALLLVIHNIIGNWIEPKMMGNSLSLNTVTVLVGLVFWGKLWGISGMILSVPLLVLTKVILARIPDAQILVRLMGSSVSVEDPPPPSPEPPPDPPSPLPDSPPTT